MHACLHACMRGRCAHARSAHLALRPTPLAVGRARGGAARAGPVRAALPRTRVPAARAAAAACCADQRKPRADQPTPHCARAHRCPTLTPHGLCARACAASVPTPASSLGCAAASARLPGRKEAFPPIECQARTGPQGAGRRSTGPLGSAACEAANMCSHESVRWLDGGASLAPKGNADRSEARGSQTCSSSLMAAGSRFKKDAHDMAGIILSREPDEGDQGPNMLDAPALAWPLVPLSSAGTVALMANRQQRAGPDTYCRRFPSQRSSAGTSAC